MTDSQALELSQPKPENYSTDEDASRMRKDQGAQTFSVLRHIALNLLRREHSPKRGIKARRKRAGWDRDYLLQVLAR